MADTTNSQSERRHHLEPATRPLGLHDWRGHTQEGVAWEIHKGDAERVLKDFQPNSFNCVITSPPYYWQRDYKVIGQIGQEKTIEGFVKSVADTMDQVRRVLAPDGLLFLNLGDTYYSAKGQPKGTDKKSAARRFGLRAVDASGHEIADHMWEHHVPRDMQLELDHLQKTGAALSSITGRRERRTMMTVQHRRVRQ